VLAHIHPSRQSFTCEASPSFNDAFPPGSESGNAQGPPSAQGSFARVRRYPQRRTVTRHVSRRYPTFSATTSPCVRPNPSRPISVQPYRVGLCRLLPAPAGRRPFPTLSPRVFPWMPRPMPRWVVKVHVPVSSFHDNGLPYGLTGRLTHHIPLSNFRAGKHFGTAVISLCFGLQVCLPSRLLLPLRFRRMAAMAFTFELNVRRCLRTHRIC